MSDHLVFDSNLQTLKCLHCNESYSMSLPATFNMVMAIMRLENSIKIAARKKTQND